MAIIVTDLEQGTPEWFAARAGIPTASSFDLILTAKGEPSKSQEKYAHTLAGERVLGYPEESYSSDHMERGKLLEDEARELYEFLTGNTVTQVGLIYLDDRSAACSPDGLVGDDGGLEIKCPKLSTHVGYLLEDRLPADYHRQVQGSLFVSGRQWWDFMSYYPGMRPLVVRVFPDVRFHRCLAELLANFNKLVEEIAGRIGGRVNTGKTAAQIRREMAAIACQHPDDPALAAQRLREYYQQETISSTAAQGLQMLYELLLADLGKTSL
ncbi:MAG: YqaJ viral recombinase family protein [Desulfofustis sp.]|jgi:hypothetical protein|nr:YqaJ viral recombinase family protein [Desulfofustis sp.]